MVSSRNTVLARPKDRGQTERGAGPEYQSPLGDFNEVVFPCLRNNGKSKRQLSNSSANRKKGLRNARDCGGGVRRCARGLGAGWQSHRARLRSEPENDYRCDEI